MEVTMKANIRHWLAKTAPVALLALTATTLAGCEPGPLPDSGVRTSEIFHSDLLDEDLKLMYRLPPDYDSRSDDTFQTVYQLDPTFVGLKQMAFTVGFVSDMEASGEIDSTIVVGIDYATGGGYQRFRDFEFADPLTPDFAGDKSDLFYEVLRDEIIPHVEATVRASALDRTLVGHSMGGRFSLYSAFRQNPADPLFTRFVANDPSYHENLFEMERWQAEGIDDMDVSIFLGMAMWNGSAQEITHDWMQERLADRGYPSLRLDARKYDTDHGGVIGPGYEDGLRFVLGGAI